MLSHALSLFRGKCPDYLTNVLLELGVQPRQREVRRQRRSKTATWTTVVDGTRSRRPVCVELTYMLSPILEFLGNNPILTFWMALCVCWRYRWLCSAMQYMTCNCNSRTIINPHMMMMMNMANPLDLWFPRYRNLCLKDYMSLTISIIKQLFCCFSVLDRPQTCAVIARIRPRAPANPKAAAGSGSISHAAYRRTARTAA